MEELYNSLHLNLSTNNIYYIAKKNPALSNYPKFMLPPDYDGGKSSKPKYNIDKEPITKVIGENIYAMYQLQYKLSGGWGFRELAIEAVLNDLDKIWPGYNQSRVETFLTGKINKNKIHPNDIYNEFTYLLDNTNLSQAEIIDHVLYFSNRDPSTTDILKIYNTEKIILAEKFKRITFGQDLNSYLKSIINFFKNLFSREGVTSKQLHNALVYEKAKIFAALYKANLTQIRLNRLIKDLSSYDKYLLLDVLHGAEPDRFKPKNLSLEQRKNVLDSVVEMRTQLNEYIEKFRESGYLKVIQNTIFLENDGFDGYVSRVYRVFHDDLWVEIVRKDPLIWQSGREVVGEFLNHRLDSLERAIRILEIKNKNLKEKLSIIKNRIEVLENLPAASPNEIMELRRLKIQRDKLLYPIEVNDTRIKFRKSVVAENRCYDDSSLDRATKIFIESLAVKYSNNTFPSGLKFFKRIKKIPQAIRDLMGEYGIEENFELSISQMVNIYHHIITQQLLEEFNQNEKLYSTRPEFEKGFVHKIILTNRYGHLVDVLGSKEIYSTKKFKRKFKKHFDLISTKERVINIFLNLKWIGYVIGWFSIFYSGFSWWVMGFIITYWLVEFITRKAVRKQQIGPGPIWEIPAYIIIIYIATFIGLIFTSIRNIL